ncbi:hypothetical protein BaRGS_00002646 [Batillaria attramentaria]|uniref:Uncharacterized protein n=1 Tax=Batillaria attramentaria TaxID=370345 RepID=A0ABD0M1Y1_9CAEN
MVVDPTCSTHETHFHNTSSQPSRERHISNIAHPASFIICQTSQTCLCQRQQDQREEHYTAKLHKYGNFLDERHFVTSFGDPKLGLRCRVGHRHGSN